MRYPAVQRGEVGRTVVISGVPGTGKTALMNEYANRLMASESDRNGTRNSRAAEIRRHQLSARGSPASDGSAIRGARIVRVVARRRKSSLGEGILGGQRTDRHRDERTSASVARPHKHLIP